MKFTMPECMSRINQALNYPALSYNDVSHFFDQAIAELNTSLRISLPTVTEMRLEHTFKVAEHPSTIVLNEHPKYNIETVYTVPTSFEEGELPVKYFVDTRGAVYNTFYVYDHGTSKWNPFDKVYAILTGGREALSAIRVGNAYATWCDVPLEVVSEFSLTDYLPIDWLMLFIIPYVCFKFAVRNGDNGTLFSDEFVQGFQQLQTSYNVPNTVTLSTVAHLPAYRKLAEANLNNLNQSVSVRAIYDTMKVPNGIGAVYGAGVYESGGWVI